MRTAGVSSSAPRCSSSSPTAACCGGAEPRGDAPPNAHIADWGTLTGTVCFSVGGLLQLFERP
ncbi:hypothetical protein E6R62_25885 [Streptomyces sp. A1136]|nr:hypothetical protein E6R62_25885 [Streptomyces sp. A1136]